MPLIIISTLLTALLGPAVAAIVWGAARRRLVPIERPARIVHGVVAGILVLVGVALALDPLLALSGSGRVPFGDAAYDARFAVPLILGILALLALPWPLPRRGERGVAHLTPRTVGAFARPRWFVAVAVLVVVIVGVTVVLGFASAPDEEGNYTMYFLEIGTVRAGTSIYGWAFSALPLALIAALLLLTFIDLGLLARRPLGGDAAAHARRRRRLGLVVSTAAGALSLHLAAVLASVRGTATLAASVSSSTAGLIDIGTPFAMLIPVTAVASAVATTVGLGLWTWVACAALPTGARTSGAVRA